MIVFLTAGNICDTFACPLCSCPLRQEFLGSREELIGDNLDQLWLLCGSRISDVMPDKDLAETRYSERVEVKAWLKVESSSSDMACCLGGCSTDLETGEQGRESGRLNDLSCYGYFVPIEDV